MPALADRVVALGDGLTWTYHIRSGVKWSDGQPVTRQGRGVHLQPDDDQHGRGHRERQLRRQLRQGHRARRHTWSSPPSTPQATMLALDVPIVPQHVWPGSRTSASSTTTRPPGTRSSATARSSSPTTSRASTSRWRPTRTTGAARPRSTSSSTSSSTTSTPPYSALVKGDIDLLTSLTPTQFNTLKHTKNIDHEPGRGQPVRGHGHQLRYGDQRPARRSATATRASRTSSSGRRSPRPSTRHTLVKNVYGGYAQPGTSYIPPRFATYHWTPTGSQARKFDPAAANAALDAAGYPKGPDGIRLGKDGKPLGLSLIGDASSDPGHPGGPVHQGLAAGHRHRREHPAGDQRTSSTT